MTVEERGKREDLPQAAASAELPPQESPIPAKPEDGEVLTETAAAAVENSSQASSTPDAMPEQVDSSELTKPDESADSDSVEAEAPTDGAAAAQDGAQAEAAPAEAASESTAEASESGAEDEQAAADPASAPAEKAPAKEKAKYQRGRVYPGVISSTTPTAVYVDLGDGDQGLVPGRELELMTRKMLESLTVGAEVDVYVVNPRNHRGETVLSINHALEELDWRNADRFAKSKEVYEAQVGGYNKGGLIVRFGRLRGFVPQSQLGEDRVRNLSGDTPEERFGPMVNQPIGVKVMEVNRHRNRLILSERAATREVRQRRKEALIADLKVGEIRQGQVVSLESFGAFVDIGGGEGLIHVSELAWGHITHPRQAVSIGDEVEVEVINVDREAKRIGLSRRRVIRDPWDEIATSVRRGQLIRGRVTKLTKFGAFARLIDHDSVEGLIHISELSGERVDHPREVVNRGDELVLRIIKIDIKDRRLGLSLKSVQSTEYLDLDWEMAIQDAASLPPAETDAEPGAPSEAAPEE